jgi:hypothetical protein
LAEDKRLNISVGKMAKQGDSKARLTRFGRPLQRTVELTGGYQGSRTLDCAEVTGVVETVIKVDPKNRDNAPPLPVSNARPQLRDLVRLQKLEGQTLAQQNMAVRNELQDGHAWRVSNGHTPNQ